MSRYFCYQCGISHTTENMAAFCASCFAGLRKQMCVMRESLKKLDKLLADPVVNCGCGHDSNDGSDGQCEEHFIIRRALSEPPRQEER